MINYHMVEQVSLASCEYDPGIDEFVMSGFSKKKSTLISPPSVDESHFIMECKLYDILNLGGKPGSGNLILGDSTGASSDRVVLGASSDLSIYHDGSHSYIEESGTGKLRILTSELLIANPSDNENIAKFIQNGAVENLYDWAAFNNCDGPIIDSNEPNTVYSIQRFTSCENNTEVALFTSHAGGHNLYVNDICDDISYNFVWGCLGNQGTFDTHLFIWDFVSRFSKNESISN